MTFANVLYTYGSPYPAGTEVGTCTDYFYGVSDPRPESRASLGKRPLTAAVCDNMHDSFERVVAEHLASAEQASGATWGLRWPLRSETAFSICLTVGARVQILDHAADSAT